MVGGINAVIVGNYLTTLGRDPQEDLDLLAELSMPVKELSQDAVSAEVARDAAARRTATGCGEPAAEGAHERCAAAARPAALLHDVRAQAGVQVLPDAATTARVRPLPLSARRAARGRAAPRAARRSRARRGRRCMLDGREVLLLCSNDYLGLAGDPRVRDAAARGRAALGRRRRGVAAGQRAHDARTASSRQRLAELKGTEACVLFGSGFLANTGVIAALATRRRRGLATRSTTPRSSTAAGSRGRRRSSTRTAIDARAARAADVIVTDARLLAWTATSRRCGSPSCVETGARVIVDEAHATGVIGAEGRGLVARARARSATSSRSARSARRSAATARSPAATRETADFLVNRARTLIYSTALPPPSVGAALKALELMDARAGRRGCTPTRGCCAARARASRSATCRSCRWSSASPTTAMALCAAALERGRLRPGDPPADGARGHVAAAARRHRRARPDDLSRLYENVMSDRLFCRRRELVPTGDVRQHGR